MRTAAAYDRSTPRMRRQRTRPATDRPRKTRYSSAVSQSDLYANSAMLAAFTRLIWEREPDITHLVVPVNSANVASWRGLLNAGFRLVARGEMEPDNPTDGPDHEILRIDRNDDAS